MGKLINLEDYRKRLEVKENYSNIELILDTIMNRLTYYEYKEFIGIYKNKNKKE